MAVMIPGHAWPIYGQYMVMNEAYHALFLLMGASEAPPADPPARRPLASLAPINKNRKQKRTKMAESLQNTNTNVWTTYYILDNLERGTV